MARRVGQRVQQLRDEAGSTQEALAKRAGITRGYLARIETGRHEPSLTMMGRLARALRVPVRALLHDAGDGAGGAWRALAEIEEMVREHLRQLHPSYRSQYEAMVQHQLFEARKSLARGEARLKARHGAR